MVKVLHLGVIPICEQALVQALSSPQYAVKTIVLIQAHLQPSQQSVLVVFDHTGTPLFRVSNQATINQG
jgi:hypothetical protein